VEIKHFRVISSLGLPVPDLVELEEDAGPDVLVPTGNEESVRIVRAVAQVLQVEQALPGLNNKKKELTTERSKGFVVFEGLAGSCGGVIKLWADRGII
jgi:hypothetical protein